MYTRVAITMFLVCGGLAAPLSAQAAGRSPSRGSNLASYDWSVKASPNLANRPPSMRVLVKFLNSVDSSTGGDGDIGDSESDEDHIGYVCSFRFADLRRNGSLSLIAGIGVTGRGYCRDVYIVDKTASGFEIYSSGGTPGDGGDITGSLKDLRHDGSLEFLIDDTLGDLQGKCAASWTAIYAWTGRGYTKVSDKFKDFYRQRLDSIDKTIPTLQPCCVSEGPSLKNKECLQAEAAKIQRFLGVSPEAGIDQAIRLAKSQDPGEREFAANLLGQIATPTAKKYLEALAKDSAGNVAYIAKYCLAAVAKGGLSDAPDEFQLLKQDPVLKH
jgi:hypothetical protein